MDQSNVTVRNDYGFTTEQIAELQAMMEKIKLPNIIIGEKPTPQAEFLTKIPAEKAQDPHTQDPYTQDPYTPNKQIQHTATESTSSTGERPTAKTRFLTKFSAEKPQHPRQPSHYSNIKLKSTPQRRIAGQGYKPHFGGEPTQYGSQSRTAVMRWRPEELRTYAWFMIYPIFRKKTEKQAHFAGIAGRNSRSSPAANSLMTGKSHWNIRITLRSMTAWEHAGIQH